MVYTRVYRKVYPRWCIPGITPREEAPESLHTRFTVGGQFSPRMIIPVSLLADSSSHASRLPKAGLSRFTVGLEFSHPGINSRFTVG